MFHNKIIKIFSLFIFNKKQRRAFRKKYYKTTLQENLDLSFEKINLRLKTISYQNQSMFWYGLGKLINQDIKECKKEFFKNLPSARGNLRILQKTMSAMLQSFKEICDANNISYWLQAGSLLGAVRHNGWIPWDDDLDIGILEDELRKLKKVLKNHPVFRIDDYYHFKKGYVGRFTRFKYKDKRINCFLDLPVYEYCDGETLDSAWEKVVKNRQDFEKQVNKIKSKLSRSYQNEIITNKKDLAIVKEFYKKEIEKVHQSDGKYIYWASYCVNANWKRIFPKSIFYPLAKLPFEGVEYTVPNKYEKYLSKQYKNIYEMPIEMFPKHTEYFNLFENIEVLEKLLQERGENVK